MDVQTIRRLNLEHLVSEAGSQNALALRLEWTANYISQILNGHRNLGDKSARWIERSLGMEHGALDGVLDGASDPVSEPSPDENERAALASVPVPVLTLEELSRPALVSVALEWRSGPSRGFIGVGETIQAQHGQAICGVSLDDHSPWSIAVIVGPVHLRAGDVVLKRPEDRVPGPSSPSAERTRKPVESSARWWNSWPETRMPWHPCARNSPDLSARSFYLPSHHPHPPEKSTDDRALLG